MRILLINPNRYQCPPTPPIGLEYLITPLEEAGHEVAILDLCFSADIYGDCGRSIGEVKPNIVGITIRNLDTALYPQTEFFLDEIRGIITYIKSHGIPVVAGGAGFSGMPEQVLSYVKADYGIAGPGEGGLPALLEMLARREVPGQILNGWDFPWDQEVLYRRGCGIDYQRYREKGGVAGFETHKGCPELCIYCLEAGTRLNLRNPVRVVQEIASLVELGNASFHLCDSEFNTDQATYWAFLMNLISAGLSIRWSLYMKPKLIFSEFFTLLRKSGADVITLTVNSYELRKTGYRDVVSHCIRRAQVEQATLAVDLLLGFPFESISDMKDTLDFFRTYRPFSVGFNTSIRIYPRTRLFDFFGLYPEHRTALIRPMGNDDGFVLPVFYQHPASGEIAEWIAKDPLFRLEGTERGTNYQRFQRSVLNQ